MAATEGVDAWLFPAAVVTVAIGAFGVLGARQLLPLIAFAVVGSMGTLMLAVAAFTPAATLAALFYLVHTTFATAALFLLADLVLSRRENGTLTTQPPIVQNGLFAALFFAAAIGMAGMPPLSGFLGKLLVLDALRTPSEMAWAWSAILTGSLLTIVGFARAGSTLFWKSTAVVPQDAPGNDAEAPGTPVGQSASALEVAPTMAALAILAILAVFAGPISAYMDETSAQLYDRAGYISSVLGAQEEN